jgi:hypothetical protein
MKCLIIFKMGDKKIILGKQLSYPGKTKITKVNFRMNFVRLPPRASTKNVCLMLAFKKNLTTQPVGSFKSQPLQPVIVNPILCTKSDLQLSTMNIAIVDHLEKITSQ